VRGVPLVALTTNLLVEFYLSFLTFYSFFIHFHSLFTLTTPYVLIILFFSPILSYVILLTVFLYLYLTI
jgi:hypothetical protein